MQHLMPLLVAAALVLSTSGARPAALSEIHTGSISATTSGTTGGRTVGVVVRSAKQGAGSCIVFDNQAEFEAFNAAEGNVLKGIEDFEEPPPGAGFLALDDPLCGGIPNGPFPNGIDQLNLCVQSNILGGAPDVPSPRGGWGLFFFEFGSGFGESSNIVVANRIVDSFDLMFGDPVPPDQQDNHTGVGFDAVSLYGGSTVAIRVFDKNNVEMVSANSPSDPAGSNFWGVWCPDTIGRINVFDPSKFGAEGADNIQMWIADGTPPCVDCPTDVDGDGRTDAFDLAFLLGHWGPVMPDSACLDADDDGIIGAFDLAVVLGAWGPCP